MQLPPVEQAPLPIDPRFRRRRVEVKRDEGRRRLRLLLSAVVIALLSVGAWLATRSPFLDVDHVRVGGADRTPIEAVVEAAGIQRRQAMVDVDVEDAAAAVETLPWVGRATVRRLWPGAVLITVSERRPVAVTSTNSSEWATLDATGRVLELSPSQPAGLMVIEGLGDLPAPGATVEGAEGPLSVLAALTPALRARTASLVAGDTGSIEIKLNPRGIVRLGPPDDVATKVRAAETVLASVDARNLAVLDVRLPASPVLTRG